MRTHNHYRRRRGLATLEFALAMPLLLTLIVGIVWLGFALAGQSAVTVSARNKAWRLRHGGSADNPQSGPVAGEEPFVFVKTGGLLGNMGLIDEQSETTVKVSPLYDSWQQPKANHVVLGGSWDFNSLDLNSPPNWKEYGRVALSAKTAGLQGAMTDVQSLMDGIGDAAMREIAEAMAKQLGDAALSALSGGRGDLDGLDQ